MPIPSRLLVSAPLLAVLALAWSPGRAFAIPADTLFVPAREDHSPDIIADPAGRPVIVWVATAPDTNPAGRFDELALVTRDSAGWSPPEIVAGPGNYYTPSVVFASDGARWITWVEHDGTDSRILCQRSLGATTQIFELGDPARPDLEPSICPDLTGGVVVVWQGWRDGNYEILLSQGDGSGFSPPSIVSDCGFSDREPRVVWGNGKAWIVWSSYRGEPYNLMLRTFDGTTLSPVVRLTDSYRARNLHPSIAWDETHALLWIASLWVNQGWTWFNRHEWPALYDLGSPRIRAFDGTDIFLPLGLNEFDQYPILPMEGLGYERFLYGSTPMPDRFGTGLDVVPVAGGRVWVLHKQVGSLTEFGTANRYWGVVGLHYGGSSWSPPTQLLDQRSTLGWEPPAAAASGDTLWVVWSADDRTVAINGTALNLFGADLDLVVAPVVMDTTDAGPIGLTSIGPPTPPGGCAPAPRPQFTIDDGGTARTIHWGDNHRHSLDLSWDAYSDPPFKETAFYSLDFLGHDFLVPSDHAERFSKAIWAWVVKWAMLYDVPGRFRVFPGYERSMRGGAGGDQNSIYRDPAQFSEAAAAYPAIESWHTMYSALEGLDVISVPHTTAQCGGDAGTDWAHLAGGKPDSLPAPLRVVEVYQSARQSFEYPGCPLQYTGCVMGPDSGWVSVALAMGMRCGILSASDHTIRAGFIGALAENPSRDAIWQAIYDRHCFGTSRGTKMHIDFRVGGAIMGSEIESFVPPTIFVQIENPDTLGFADLAFIEINKDGNPGWFVASTVSKDTTITFLDPDPVIPGTSSFYYLRIRDSGTKAAWTSPVWVDFLSPPTDAAGLPNPPGESPVALAASPNPSRGEIRFRWSGMGSAGGRIRIYDVTGRLVRRADLRPGSVEGGWTWDARDEEGSRVAPGSYFAVFQTRGETRTARVVLVR